eukprot:TRINITY_DN835_c0_g1_i1.p1 TRINITY_DN835_c0_g1~~TRINITY_DN835_c0_g1_i1.p1  ORF type:complete len:425 (-),score=126.63 TRINITY_DN835_c0_g1_i1:47-1321(-)
MKRVGLLLLLVLLPSVVFGAINFQWNNLVVLGQPNTTTTFTTQLTNPAQISVASDSSVWVADRSGTGRFLQYATNGLLNGAASSSSNINTVLSSPFLPDSLRVVGGSSLLASPSSSLLLWPTPSTSNNSISFNAPTPSRLWGSLFGLDVSGNTVYASANLENRIFVLQGPNYTLSGIIGQPDINSTNANQPNGVPSASNFNSTWGVKADCQGGVWVADRGNRRLLHFAAGATTADVVLGQTSFTSVSTNTSDVILSSPSAIDLNADCSVMYVADSSRVLRFTAPFTTGKPADGVLGQTSYSGTGRGVGPERFSGVSGVDFDDATGYLWLADAFNNRVIGGSVANPTTTGNTGNTGTNTGNTGNTGTTTAGNTGGTTGTNGTTTAGNTGAGSGTGSTGSGGVSGTSGGAAARFGGIFLSLAKFFY